VKSDDKFYFLARKAYISSCRAYARLPDKKNFALKNLNLTLLANTYGLSKVGGKNDTKSKTYTKIGA
jgi:hypothetical protein